MVMSSHGIYFGMRFSSLICAVFCCIAMEQLIPGTLCRICSHMRIGSHFAQNIVQTMNRPGFIQSIRPGRVNCLSGPTDGWATSENLLLVKNGKKTRKFLCRFYDLEVFPPCFIIFVIQPTNTTAKRGRRPTIWLFHHDTNFGNEHSGIWTQVAILSLRFVLVGILVMTSSFLLFL